MTIIEALILGIVQGLTEFLPISSSGHIELGKFLLDIKVKDNLLFSVIVHFATALSTIVVFRKDIFDLIKGLFAFRYNESTEYVFKLLLSMIPVGLVGLFFEDQISAFFDGNILLVGAMLLVTGLLLTFTYYKKETDKPVSYPKALIIGITQAIAILPGISRSGSTIATALLLNVDKSKAARFSFLMVLLPIIGASLLKLKDYAEGTSAASDISAAALVTGFLAAFIAGLVACQWMITIVKRGKLIYFAVYCYIIGFIAIVSMIFYG